MSDPLEPIEEAVNHIERDTPFNGPIEEENHEIPHSHRLKTQIPNNFGSSLNPETQSKISEKKTKFVPPLEIPHSQKNVKADALPTTNASSKNNLNPNEIGCEKTSSQEYLIDEDKFDKNLEVDTEKINSIFNLKKPYTERSKLRQAPEEGNLLLKDRVYKDIIHYMNEEDPRRDVVVKKEKPKLIDE